MTIIHEVSESKPIPQAEGKVHMLTIRGVRYRTNFNHPGGPSILRQFDEATAPFEAYHDFDDPKIQKWLKLLRVDEAPEVKKSARATAMEKDWAKIHQAIKDEGLDKINVKFFALITALMVALYASALYFWTAYPFFAAALLGFAWQNSAFIGHDVGHNSYVKGLQNNMWCSVVLSSIMGIDMCWWKASHNNHHVVPNCLELDQDVQHQPFFSTSTEHDCSYFSNFFKRVMPKGFVRFQSFYFYPFMCVARLNLYAQGILHTLKMPPHQFSEMKPWSMKIQLGSFAFFLCTYTYLMWLLPDWQTRITSLLISHAIAGLLHIQILLSHYAEPIYKDVERGNDLEWYIRSQCESSVNIASPNLLTDLFHGGLHMQIDHHIFPRVQRCHLNRVSELLEPFCKKYGFPYRTIGFFEANLRVLKALRKVEMTRALLFAEG